MESLTSFSSSENKSAGSQGIVLQMVKPEPTDTVTMQTGPSFIIHVAPAVEKSRNTGRTAQATRSRSRSPLNSLPCICSEGGKASPVSLNPQTSMCQNQASGPVLSRSTAVSGSSTATTTTTTTILTTAQFTEPFKLSVIRSENGLFVCNYPGCGRLCRRQGDILRHQQSHLIRRISYACDQPECSGVVAATDETCSPCGHVQMNPPVQYVARCDFPGCGRQFTRHGSLKSHFRIHWKFLSLLNTTSENTESSPR